ncbi:hypothetical protein KP509_32G033400 [Ceratopteris richardii]|uniref:CW-type domain-containing protein n=1 Tax=Ceratopteris richardii TaxID=49495 RepID=A0A8T2QSA6_CERRI|nr:hypothetical protein KP509_32G033400 [Ceratopteris richardii]
MIYPRRQLHSLYAHSSLPTRHGVLSETTIPILTDGNRNEDSRNPISSNETMKLSFDTDNNKKSLNCNNPRGVSEVREFTVQCASCLKWRLIPTRRQYQEIRQSLLEKPFFCSTVGSWRPGVNCNDPSDVTQDGSHIWAIDLPNIPAPPPGWERKIIFRGSTASRFADMSYEDYIG